VDDGSVDSTADVVRTLSETIPCLKVISHERNLGKGAAVRSGVLATAGSLILCADADGATPFREYYRLLTVLKPDVQIAVGARQKHSGNKVRRTLGRAILGRVFRGLVHVLLHPGVKDTQCGFKLFRGEVGRQLFRQSTENGFLFDLEILGLASRKNLVVQEVPVDWNEVPGSKVRCLRDSWRMVLGLFRIRRAFNRTEAHCSAVGYEDVSTLAPGRIMDV